MPSLAEIRSLNQAGRAKDAEAGARVLLSILERGAPVDSLSLGETLDELSIALRRGGKAGQPESEQVGARAIAIKERSLGKRSAGYAASLYNMGMLWYARDDASRAISILQETLEIRVAALGSEHRDVALTLLAIGAVHSQMGKDVAAEEAIDRAVSIQKATLEADDPDRLRGLNALGSVLYRTGQFSKAVSLYEESLGLLERSASPNQALLGEVLHNLGCLLSEVGDGEQARTVLERALRVRRGVHGGEHPLVASTLVALGESFYDARSYERARSSYTEALKIQRASEDSSADVAWTLMKLGWSSLALDRPEVASRQLSEARAIQERLLGDRHPQLWLTLVGLAELEHAKGRNRTSRDLFERAIGILQDAYGPYFLDLGPTRDRYARVLLASADSSEALACSVTGAEVNRTQLRLTSQGLAERQALRYTASLNPLPEVALSVVSGDRYRGDSALVAKVWDSLILSRALVLDEMGSRNRLFFERGTGDASVARLREARRRLAGLLVRGPAGREDYPTVLAAARSEAETAERDLARVSASFRSLRDLERVGWMEVLQTLPPRSALVAFALYGRDRDRAYVALVLGADRGLWAIRIGGAEALDEKVLEWHRSIRTALESSGRLRPGAERECRISGERVRRAVWDPLALKLDGAERIFIVPDGTLHLVSFGALPVGRTSYLVEHGPVLHLLSAERELVREPATQRGDGILALGGASFGRLPGSVSRPATTHERAPCEDFRTHEFEPLPGSEEEVKRIAKIWGDRSDVALVTGAQATEAAFRSLAPGREVVHVASHGFFFRDSCEPGSGSTGTRGIGGVVSPAARPSRRPPRDNPLRLSGIAMAGANRRGQTAEGTDDGILTAEEIASVDLSRVSWVVLSACDTGLGEIQSGEGVLGLRRAFQIAGAGTLVMSLWAVEDKSALEWMADLYAYRVRHGLGTSDAIREASRNRLQARRKEGRGTHPYFWAGFVAAGAWD